MLSTVSSIPALTTTAPTQRPEGATTPPRDTVMRLLTAAAAAFADKGFHGTTTRDMASRAGLSPAGVYVHFESKEDVLYQLSRQGHQEALALVTAAAASADTPPQQLAAVMSRFSAWHAENYHIARVVQHEFPHLSLEHRDEVLDLRKRIDSTVRQVLRAGRTSGDFVLDKVADTTLALLSIVVDVARWYSPAISRTPEQIGATNAALGLRLVGYAGSVPPRPPQPDRRTDPDSHSAPGSGFVARSGTASDSAAGSGTREAAQPAPTDRNGTAGRRADRGKRPEYRRTSA